MYFPAAGVELNPFVPILVGALASLIFGQVGLTGGIATLPFMMSVLNFTSPSVTPTNLIFVLLSPLGSVYSYWEEKRVLWRLGLLAGAGGIAGSYLGPLIRVGILYDAFKFKTLFAILLGILGFRLYFRRYTEIQIGKIERTSGSYLTQSFIFSGVTYRFHSIPVFLAGLLAGIVSTIFGIGTGFLLIPFYTTVLKLPIYAVASSALLSTLVISIAGTVAYSTINIGVPTAPDLGLGVLLGLGGIVGGFASAKVQRHFSIQTLHKILGAALILWALAFLRQGF